MRILTIDIETSPILCWTWGLWKQDIYPQQIVQPSALLCWGAKWLGESDVEWHGRCGGHKKMIRRVWKLLDDADTVIHYNGNRFDVPRIQREFLKADLPPPSPFKQIDLLLTARKKFQFDSNKLEEVARSLGIGKKEEHEGFKLWMRCLDGEASAWDRMKRYNVHDVRLTERLYLEKLRPWVNNHPSYSAFEGRDVCPKCGQDSLVRRGTAFLRTGNYQRFRCSACKSWHRSTKRDGAAAVTELVA